MTKSNKNDKILSTPSITGSYGLSESSNLSIDSGHVEADNKDLFINFGEHDTSHRTEKTMNLKPDKSPGKIL